MQPDTDAQLTNFFEEAPPREFATVMRGYDRHQVDEHIRQIETEVRQHREQTQTLRQQLTDAHRQIQEQERPTHSSLGARIEQLLRLAEEQATELVQAARSEANEIKAAAKVDAAELRAAAEGDAAELRAAAAADAAELRGAAEREADSIRTTARREADELTNTTEREVAKLRATADHEVADKRAGAERDIAKLRTSTEREVAQLKATAKRERDEILTTSKRQADEMRSQAQRILEESEAQRAQSEAEFEIQLAARREEAERQEAERLAAAQSATQKLVSEAEQRASTAEQRAAKASAQADQTRRDADSHARQLVSNAKKNADQIVSQAKAQADQLLAETKADAERRRAAAQRDVDELTRQKDSIATHLAQVRQLLGGQLPMATTKRAATSEPGIELGRLAEPRPDGPTRPVRDSMEAIPGTHAQQVPGSGLGGRLTGGSKSARPQDGDSVPRNSRGDGSGLTSLPPDDPDPLTSALREMAGADDGQSRTTRESLLPISIYLADEHIHEDVEAAVNDWLASAGLEVEVRDTPVIGSWYRKIWAGVKQAIHSPAAADAALTAIHAADTRLILAQDAVVTATLLQNLGPVITSLQPTKDAVLRAGALLIVKVDWVVQVFQLTAAQQAVLNHKPQLASSPQEIIAALELSETSATEVVSAAE